MKAFYQGSLTEIDKNFDATFFTEWETRLASAMELVTEQDLVGTDRYQSGELVAGMATVPQSSEGANYVTFAPQEGKTVNYQTDIYKFGFRATEELRDYGRTGQIMEYSRLMAELADHTVKVGIYNIFNKAFNSALFANPYDAAALIATSHTLANGSTASNRLASDADLSETSLEAMIELFIDTPNEDGAFIARVPRILLGNTANWSMATKLTGSATTMLQGVGESGNSINAVTRAHNIVPHFSPYITDTDASYLIGERSPVRLVWSRRPELKPVFEDPMTEDWVWRLKMQFKVTADTWRGIVGTSGA